ncbi:MAG: hypothetical protein EBT13_08050 [Rhodobacteraceae bacterium]|nr:hypothetical protein [Paracoccaceae bacterium]
MRRIVVLLICLLAPISAHAQMAAGLIADNVTVTADNQLMAQGNVEVLYDGTKLSAAAIVYDQATDSLTIEGPILIRTADGTILTATRATLDPRLENGILISETGRLVALIGLEDVIVVDTPDALLITTKEHAQRVKNLVDSLKNTGHSDVL